MGSDQCMDCKKWEEEIYWSRFQTVQFFQILTGKFDQQLAIPKKFTNNLREKMIGTITLRGPSGNVWNVGLVTNGDMLLLKNGWKEFVKDHSLEQDDILIFKYNGDSIFDVLMFDNETGCEKEASYFVKKCEHTESGLGSKKRKSVKESSSDSASASASDSSTDIATHQLKKPRRDAAKRPSSRKWTTRSTTKGRRGIKKGKRGSSGAYPVELTSRRRAVSEEEKKRAQEMAVQSVSENGFIVVMRASHVYKGFFMSIPYEWARVHLPNKAQDIELRVTDRTWHAKYYFRGYGGGLTGGWKDFVLENFLEEFDVCVFNLVNGTQDEFILDVKIFRVVEEVIPPSPVMRVSSRGRRKRLMKRLRCESEEDKDEDEEV